MGNEEIEKSRNMLVVKENNLIQCASYRLTLEQQKFLCYVISKVKPTDKEFQRYTISALDFAEICGIDKKNVYTVFKKMAEDFNDKKRWIKIGDNNILFSPFNEPEYNEKNGSITVILNSRLKKYLVGVGTKYTKYELWNILSLKSKHSLRLYELFRSYSYQHEKEFAIEDLKSLLCVEQYKNFADLKKRVLDKGIEEINIYTDLKVRYEISETGRGGKVKKIIFYIDKKIHNDLLQAFVATCDRINEKNGQIKGQLSFFDMEIEKEIRSKSMGYVEMKNK